MFGNLKIFHININGLRNKLHEVTAIFHHYDPTVLAITETKLDKTITDGLLMINGFKFLRLDRPESTGGGLVLYHKGNVSLKPIKSHLSDCESLYVDINISRRKSLKVMVIYRPPSTNIHNFICSLD